MLDLRGNPGGLLDEAVLSASLFLPEGEVVVSTNSRTQGDSVHKTVGGNLPKLPLVVLIDRGTASAAEILTAALADDAGAAGGRHPLLRQGRLPGGEGPRQRRRPEADGRRVLHPRRASTWRAATASTPTSRPATTRRRRRDEGEAAGARRARRPGRLMPARPRRARRGARPARPRRAPTQRAARARAPTARDAVEALLRERARLPRLPRRARGRGAARRREAAERARRRRAATSPRSRPSPSTRPPPATSTTPSPPSARATAPGSGSTSPTSPPTCGPGSPLDLEARRRANSTYVPGAVEPMLPHALSSDACSLAPGVERLAVTAEIELGPGAEPRSDALLPQPHPLRRPPRLRPARRDLRRPGAAAGGGRRTARRRPRGRRRPRRAPRRHQPRRRILRARVPLRRRGQRRRRPRRRPDRGPPPDRAADDPHQRAGRRSCCERKRVPAIYRVHAQPDPARIERLVEQLAALGVPTPPLRPGALGRSEAGEVAAEASRLVAPRGRAARARPRGVYIARAPLPQAGRTTASATAATPASAAPPTRHFTSPIRRYPDLVVPPGAAGGAGGGGGGAAPGRGPRRRRRLLGPRARVGEDRARRRRRLRRLPARTRAAASAASTPSSRARSPG